MIFEIIIMGNSSAKSEPADLSANLVLQFIQDTSEHGYITFRFVQNRMNIRLMYSHPRFAELRSKLVVDNAYRITYHLRQEESDDIYEMLDVQDAQSANILGKIHDFSMIFADTCHGDYFYRPYAEVLLTERPIKIPGYFKNDCFVVLLIDKKRIPALEKNVEYDFTVRLFQGKNVFLIGEIMTPQKV